MASNSTLTDEQQTTALRLASEGTPTSWIADTLGVSPDTMDHFFRGRPEGRQAAKNGREFNKVWTSIRPSDTLRKWHHQFAPKKTR